MYLWMRIVRISLLFGAMHVTAALAYIPPSEFILKTYVNRHAATTLQLKSVITVFHEGKPTNQHWNETLWVDTRAGVVKAVLTDGSVLASTAPLIAIERNFRSSSVLTELLFGTDFLEVAKRLKAHGIPVKVESEMLSLKTEEERQRAEVLSFKQWKNAFAWVIGRDTQLWFQKDAFVPVRLLYPDIPGSVAEIQMEDFRSDFAYPKMIRAVDQHGQTLFEEKLQDLVLGANMNKTVMKRTFPGSEFPLLEAYFNVIR